MKKMKRLAAVLLVGIMALAMLTACGGTPSTPGTPVTRDEALEKSVAEWTVELGKGEKLNLTEDAALTAISEKCLPSKVKEYDATIANDRQAFEDAVTEMDEIFDEARNGKKVAVVEMKFLKNEEVTKESLTAKVQKDRDGILSILHAAGVELPAKFGVTVTKQKDYTLILFMVSE